MDLWNANAFTRRAFLSRGMVLASSAASIPLFIESSAQALAQGAGALSSRPGIPDDHILVVVQLSGGNDGLNTVIPYADRAYYNARPGIGVQERDVLKLSGREPVGLHPRMEGLKALYDDGLLSVVQAVGYPNPNRSHFLSMDIWHTADTGGTGPGWLGKYYDCECAGADPKAQTPDTTTAAQRAAITLGADAPRALIGRKTKPITFESPDLFRWTAGANDPDAEAAYRAMLSAGAPDAPEGSNAAFLARTALDAQISADLIRKAVSRTTPSSYPRSELGRQLAMVAAMIQANLKSRVYYVTLGGFDTHAGQGGAQGRHGNLLNDYAQSLKAFYDDLKAQRNDERVLTMTFSEFGRRVGQNASGGTDHGAAAPMFFVGPMVRPGVQNAHPSLTDLDDGDLKYAIDFRSAYSGVLKEWLRADPSQVLGRAWSPLRVLKRA